MSMVRLSHPACAITSAEKELGTCNHPFTTVPPSLQILFRRFSLILVSPLGRLRASSSVASLSRRRLEHRQLAYQVGRVCVTSIAATAYGPDFHGAPLQER